MTAVPAFLPDPATRVATLANGVQVVAVELPHFDSACVSVFVRTGSRHESRQLNGISHFAEHMAFKGTRTRSCQQINLDAERLGAEVNAHTDKDHTAYHMRGLAQHAGRFVGMLADIVQGSTFPEGELERERQVILQEFAEDEDDAFSTAFKLFDRNCFGAHALAQPVIGTRRNIERFSREELMGYVQRQYTGANVVVAVAGRIDPEAIVREAESAFEAMPAGAENAVAPPAYRGGYAARRQAGVSQTHVVIGFPTPTLRDPAHHASVVAAALLGEGMSSPLMDEVRERRALVYYAACSADVSDLAGQFVIEASTGPEHVDEFAEAVVRLLRAQAEGIDAVGLERARNQIAVRNLSSQERPFRRLEEAVQDLFVHGRLRTRAEVMDHVMAVDAQQVQAEFERMLATPAAVALAGRVRTGARDRWQSLLAPAA